MTLRVDPSWQPWLEAELAQPYMLQLKQFLREQKDARKVIYPRSQDWFNAFLYVPFEQIRVVILGQDPYHGPGQAHGLCFSVLPGVRIPPSLQNIYKELQRDLSVQPVGHGCLIPWAEQGVMLLNAVLTVEQAQAGAHQGRGWETFTDHVVERLNRERDGLVFMLWGSYAQKKGRVIDRSRHCVLESVHPSPLSAHRGFIGNGHFSAANQWLQQHGQSPVDWQLPAQYQLPE
ncbi:uracil-DNA glycosylase [Pokkaliibacter plantistimulans]|uniref:Uracil-DNA glycosylase n=2 Tax=Pseudomonadota TaxID=1224 RepID=A0ABX5LS20_9GAMM|nr:MULTISPECIES: uracil-DNA glycosylase [Pokkaliibacter]MDH2431948.1 uracil-DNA glycosylase [Pokkaliibacter sp. MBI-7]PPC75877.1 uracil-DNA glycosylase [Pokkaliibacter plantistimulans]PXF29161.1 uracil-DNA glycosylase [Pokkaliibacter plantistimulans]